MLSKATRIISLQVRSIITTSVQWRYCDLQQITSHQLVTHDIVIPRQFLRTMATNNECAESDEEVCILYNQKEERSRRAIEIVIDDEEIVEMPKRSRSQLQGQTSSQSVPLSAAPTNRSRTNTTLASNSTAEDFISLNCSESSSSQQTYYPDVNLPSTSMNRSSCNSESFLIHPQEVEARRAEIEKWRSWSYTNLGRGMLDNQRINLPDQLIFSVMSYNVLSQQLLEDHPYLYEYHDKRALNWEHRSQVLLKEFALANADILCLQEVQKSHVDSFYNRLHDLGYDGIYKQRTGGKIDGVAIYYKKSLFTLKEHSSVEFYQPGISVLDRDNVALIAKLSFNKQPEKEVVVATTHLLFNPKRHDIKLAQVQLLLAEVERFAYCGEDRKGTPIYCSSVVTGDMNFEPYSGPYQLLTTGMIRYEGLSRHSLKDVDDGRPLGKSLIPCDLEVTDTCQHYSVLLQRPAVTSIRDQNVNIRLYNSDLNKYGSFKNYVNTMKDEGYVNNFTPRPHIFRGNDPIPLEYLPSQGFASGQLSHHLNLRSVYKHGYYATDRAEVTTFQKEWTTVDYIFYSGKYSEKFDNIIEGDLKLLSRLQLPKRYNVKRFGYIPNLGAPSDHFPLAAIFMLT